MATVRFARILVAAIIVSASVGLVTPRPAAAQSVKVSVTNVAVAGTNSGNAYVTISNIPTPGLAGYNIWVLFDNTQVRINPNYARAAGGV